MNLPMTYKKMRCGIGDIKVRLGDIFLIESGFCPLNYIELEGLSALALLTVAFSKNKTYFILLGMDRLKHNVSKHTDKGVVILNNKGKQIKIPRSRVVSIFREFEYGRTADIKNGIHMYLRAVRVNRKIFESTSMRRIPERMINMCEWPDKALVEWAKRHLNLPSEFIPRIENMNNRHDMINRMIKMSIARFKTAPVAKENKPEEIDLAGYTVQSTYGTITYSDAVGEQGHITDINNNAQMINGVKLVNPDGELVTLGEPTEGQTADLRNSALNYIKDHMIKKRKHPEQIEQAEVSEYGDDHVRYVEADIGHIERKIATTWEGLSPLEEEENDPDA